MGAFSDFALVPEQGAQPEMDQLPEDMQETIRRTARRVRIGDPAAVAAFGAKAQKDMSAFSEIALRQMLSEDIGPLDGVMKTLSEQIRACSFKQEAQGLLRRVFGGTAPLSEVRAAFERAEPRINDCANQMTDRRVALMRDSALLDRLYERNEALYRELCSLLVVGGEALAQAQAGGASAQDIARLDRRLQDLRVTKVASTQLAAQIRMVQEADRLTCERLQAALEVTIPLWKSQMAAALGLARATDSLRQERQIEKEAARGIRRGARELAKQKDAYREAAAGGTDAERAEETARQLLSELDEIEQGLARQRALREDGLGTDVFAS